ncbi:MAG: hypothetical protein QOE70_2861, partial [Chthoniobacter sp.]|nr:hypothetical protein [Chthoniobacter sp.]
RCLPSCAASGFAATRLCFVCVSVASLRSTTATRVAGPPGLGASCAQPVASLRLTVATRVGGPPGVGASCAQPVASLRLTAATRVGGPPGLGASRAHPVASLRLTAATWVGGPPGAGASRAHPVTSLRWTVPQARSAAHPSSRGRAKRGHGGRARSDSRVSGETSGRIHARYFGSYSIPATRSRCAWYSSRKDPTAIRVAGPPGLGRRGQMEHSVQPLQVF